MLFFFEVMLSLTSLATGLKQILSGNCLAILIEPAPLTCLVKTFI